jgi:ubiquinone/menaquinone biosynthesis C-methylase UbiE
LSFSLVLQFARRANQLSQQSEVYTPGYTANASNFMAKRRADTHAAFFLPHLHSGDRVLDCGCGPGTITAGLADAVKPGQVTGIDLAESQIALANAYSAEHGIHNVEFATGSIYNLQFEANTFDAVFAHAVFEHLATPVKALQEVHRVLKADGMLGLCSPDWGGFLIAPIDPAVEAAISFYKILQEQNGGNVYVGRQLAVYAQEAGFVDRHLSAYYECYENPATIAEYLALRLEQTTDEVALSHLPDGFTVSELADALRTWSKGPDCLFAQSWVTLTARKR